MPTRDQAPLGAPCWIELFTSDPDATRPFYEELLGWKAEEPNPDLGGYFSFHHNGRPIAGCMTNDGSAGGPDQWSVYLAGADANATAEAAVEHGGQIVVPVMDVMDLGTMAVMADAGGAAIAVWQPGTHPGFTELAEPGAPAWFELHTRSYDEAVAFYRDVFGWDTHIASDTADFRYSTFGEGEGALAGIMDDTAIGDDEHPAYWATYFAVTDCDGAVAQVSQLGGRLVSGPDDTPFGRLAVVADPAGIQFRLVAE